MDIGLEVAEPSCVSALKCGERVLDERIINVAGSATVHDRKGTAVVEKRVHATRMSGSRLRRSVELGGNLRWG